VAPATVPRRTAERAATRAAPAERASARVLAMRFFVRTLGMRQASPRNDRAFDLRQSAAVWKSPKRITIGHGTETNEIKQEAERRQTPVTLLHLTAQRAPCRARSPVGVPHRLSLGGCHPPAQLQARLPATRRERTVPDRPCGRRPCASPRALPAARLSQSSDSTSRTGRSTGMLDARSRPGAAVTNRHPQAPPPAPPDGVTAWRPVGEREGAAFTYRAGKVKVLSPRRRQ
jgi:hypothetical protein